MAYILLETFADEISQAIDGSLDDVLLSTLRLLIGLEGNKDFVCCLNEISIWLLGL